MRIPLSAPDVTEEEVQAVAGILRTGRLSLGPSLLAFEGAMADYTGNAFAVAVSSGTAGLHLCLKALDVGDGDEVITSPFSFPASANVILFERANPVFADIDPGTLNLDPKRVESAITKKTKAILAVHVFGRPCQMTALLDLARCHNLVIIEDACEALGAEWQGRKVGSLGRAGVFAFYPNKPITTGEGGMIVTDDEKLAWRARCLRNQGRVASGDWFDVEELGTNYRLSEISCELGRRQMARLPSILARRERVARRYHRRLAGHPDLLLPALEGPGQRMSWFVFVVRLSNRFDRQDRDRIIEKMASRGIGCGRYFAPIHLQPLYRRWFGFTQGAFPVTEETADRCIALPFFNQIADEQVDEVCETLESLIPT